MEQKSQAKSPPSDTASAGPVKAADTPILPGKTAEDRPPAKPAEAPPRQAKDAPEENREEKRARRLSRHEEMTHHVSCIAACVKTLNDAGLPPAQAAPLVMQVWSETKEK